MNVIQDYRFDFDAAPTSEFHCVPVVCGGRATVGDTRQAHRLLTPCKESRLSDGFACGVDDLLSTIRPHARVGAIEFLYWGVISAMS